MDLTGLNVPKLKSNAIEQWKSDPRFWPVKVMAISRVLELEHGVSQKLTAVGGYFTCLNYVQYRTPAELEDSLGFQRGTFASGVSIWKLKELPKPDEFELRGYSQTPAGENFDGIVIRRNDSRPEYLGKDGRPAKYPPGGGVAQWEIAKGLRLPATELERVPYGAKSMKWV